MEYKKIVEGIFRERPNRFIAKVEIDGKLETVHVKNTGRCKELLFDGVKVFLEDHGQERKNRKTRYSLVSLQKRDESFGNGFRMINLDSYAPNIVVGEALKNGLIAIPDFEAGTMLIKPEKTFGNSRFDYYLDNGLGKEAFIEVKGVTLEMDGVVKFPDAPTERGVRHIKGLCKAAENGFVAYLIFVIQMKNVSWFEPNDDTHPEFGKILREADNKGVRILAYDCIVSATSMVLANQVPIRLNQ